MNETEFRAWDEPNKTMVYENTYCCDLGITFDGQVFCDDSYYGIHNSNFVLMQYTGFKDKNGRKIYEGDIIGNIPYHYERYHYYIKDLDGFFFAKYDDQMHIPFEECEVIGNIHENPELMIDDIIEKRKKTMEAL